MITQLREQMARTGISSMRLLWDAKDKPDGVSSGVIETWLSGDVTTARPEHFAYVLALWSALPTVRHIPLTAAMSAALRAELSRLALGSAMLMRRLKQRPNGLTWAVIEGWANGTTDTVDEGRWGYLMKKLGQMPDGKPGALSGLDVLLSRRIISDEEIAELRAHRERTGYGGAILLRSAEDIPPGLTPAMISNWLSGNAKSACPEHVAYVLARYRAWP